MSEIDVNKEAPKPNQVRGKVIFTDNGLETNENLKKYYHFVTVGRMFQGQQIEEMMVRCNMCGKD